METEASINARAERIRDGLHAAFGVRGKTLEAALRRTGRRMPRRLHGAARQIVDAQALGGHPRRLRQVDGKALDDARDRVLEHLKGVDRADARKGRLVGMAGTMAFNVLIVFALFVTWMVWRGHL